MMITQFPYPLDLTQLETILPGFKPTDLERMVIGTPAFQRLRAAGLPPKWGELLTGLHHEESGERDAYITFPFTPLKDVELPSPSAARKLFQDLIPDLISILIMTAKVRRDANLEREEDRILLGDLNRWLDGVFPWVRGFRWERHYASLLDKAQQEEWSLRAAELKQGVSDVMVLLTAQLPPAQQQEARQSIAQSCQATHGFASDDKFWERTFLRRYSPWIRCYDCNQGLNRNNYHDERECRNIPAVIVVDSGNVAEVKSWLDKSLQRRIKVVRFRLPRSTFYDGGTRFNEIYPHLAVFTLDQLTSADKERALRSLSQWLGSKQKEEEDRDRWSQFKVNLWRRTQVITPAGTSRLNALLLAGPAIDWNLDRREAFPDGAWMELIQGGMTIALTSTP